MLRHRDVASLTDQSEPSWQRSSTLSTSFRRCAARCAADLIAAARSTCDVRSVPNCVRRASSPSSAAGGLGCGAGGL